MAASSGSGSRFSEVFGKVAIVNHWPLLMRATSDDENPVPGYMYPEISGLTHKSSNPQQCAAILSFLQDRLRKKSWHVKLKALQVMKYIAVHGDCRFRNILRRQATGIQEATKYSAIPDPLHGNAPILAVRKAATELLEVLFDDSLSGDTVSAALATKMEGFGSVPASPQKQSIGLTIVNNLHQLSSSINMPSYNQDKPYRSLQGHHPKDSRGSQDIPISPGLSSVSGRYQPVILNDEENAKTNGLPSQKSADCLGHADVPGNGHPAGRTSSSSETHSAGSSDLKQRLETVAVADWSHEVKLTNDLASKGQSSSVPSREEVDSFVKRASSLNCEKIIEILVTGMKSSEECRVAYLCGIEAILREGLVSVECILPVIKSILPDLQCSSNKTVIAKANKILRQLEQENLHSNSKSSRQSTPGEQRTVISASTSSSSANLNLFSGMSVKKNNPESREPAGVEGSVTAENLPVSGLVSDNSLLGLKWKNERMGDTRYEAQSTNLVEHSAGNEKDTHGKRTLMGVVDSIGQSGLALSCTNGDTPSQDLLSHQNWTNETLEGMDALVLGDAPSVRPELHPSLDPQVAPLMTSSTSRELSRTDIEQKRVADPLLSRDAHLSDFLDSLNPTQKVDSVKSLTSSVGRTSNGGASVGPKEHVSKTNVPQIYPQLAGAQLSSESSVPLQLSRGGKDPFGFISAKADAANGRDSFDFVQEAMKQSKR